MNVDRLILLGIGILTICRWWFAGALELTQPEALMMVEGRLLGLFYLDHGPLSAGLARLGMSVWEEPVWALRFLNPILVLLASWLLFLLARSAFHQVTARWVTVLFHMSPVPNQAGVFMIDVALAQCLVLLAAWSLWCGLHRVQRWHPAWWIGGGALGLALTLSLALVGVLLGLLVGVAVAARWRDQWERPGIWVFTGISLAIPGTLLLMAGQAPYFLGFLKHHFEPNGGAFLGGVLLWFWWTGPLLALGLIWLIGPGRPSHRDPAAVLLSVAGGIAIVVGWIFAGCGMAWSPTLWIPTPLCLIVLVGVWMQADVHWRAKGHWRRWALVTTGGLAAIGVHTATLQVAGFPWPRALATPRMERGWVEAASSIESVLLLAAARQPEGLLVVADAPGSAALLDAYLSEEALIFPRDEESPRVHVVESAGMESVYDLWSNYSHAPPAAEEGRSRFFGLSGVYITRQPEEGELPSNLRHAFRSIEPAAALDIRRRGELLHQWFLFHLYNYTGLPR